MMSHRTFLILIDMRDVKKALAEGQSPHEDLLKRKGGGKISRRAKETLERAKDCISKELVWKVLTSAFAFFLSVYLIRAFFSPALS